jgi:hypothetical protein
MLAVARAKDGRAAARQRRAADSRRDRSRVAGSPDRRAIHRPADVTRSAPVADRLVAGRQYPGAHQRVPVRRRQAVHGEHAVPVPGLARLSAPAGQLARAGPVGGSWRVDRRGAVLRRSRKRPRSLPVGLFCRAATKSLARRSRHRCGRPAHGPRRCQPSRRWIDRYASPCRRTGDPCNPGPRSSPGPPAGPPSPTRHPRGSGQTRGVPSISSITVRASRPLLALRVQP